jgi:hypothetical protein
MADRHSVRTTNFQRPPSCGEIDNLPRIVRIKPQKLAKNKWVSLFINRAAPIVKQGLPVGPDKLGNWQNRFSPPQQNLWGDSGSGSRPRL